MWQILGSGMSNKMWDVLVEHAKTCALSGKLYVYYPEDERNVGVIFNNIYEFCGLIANGQYHPADSLSENQKVIVYLQSYTIWMMIMLISIPSSGLLMLLSNAIRLIFTGP